MITPLEERCGPGFAPVLQRLQTAELERHAGTIYALNPEFRLAYFNPYWLRFVRENQAADYLLSPGCLGLEIMAVIPEVLQPFYRSIYQAVTLETKQATQPFQFEYECSSPQVFRKFLMTLYPMEGGLLVVNSLVVEEPYAATGRPIEKPDFKIYLAANGMIYQCSHCRRFQHQADPARWDWVPEWVAKMPAGISHTICNTCFGYFYSSK